MSILHRSDLSRTIETLLPDNTARNITAATFRSVLQQLVTSHYNREDDQIYNRVKYPYWQPTIPYPKDFVVMYLVNGQNTYWKSLQEGDNLNHLPDTSPSHWAALTEAEASSLVDFTFYTSYAQLQTAETLQIPAVNLLGLFQEGKIDPALLPLLDYLKIVESGQNTLEDFITQEPGSSEAFTLEQGDMVQITLDNGNRQLWMLTAPDSVVIDHYKKISDSKVDWGNVLNKVAAGETEAGILMLADTTAIQSIQEVTEENQDHTKALTPRTFQQALGYAKVQAVDYADLRQLQQESNLVVGQWYRIENSPERTHVNTRGGILVQATSANQLALQAWYHAQVPDYQSETLFWQTGTAQDKVIRNGKTFEYSGTGDKNQEPETESGTIWQEVPNEKEEWHTIHYDFAEDRILSRRDARGNLVEWAGKPEGEGEEIPALPLDTGIESFPWGNDRVNDNQVVGDSYANLLNFRGIFRDNQVQNHSRIWNNTTDSEVVIQKNTFSHTDFHNNELQNVKIIGFHTQNTNFQNLQLRDKVLFEDEVDYETLKALADNHSIETGRKYKITHSPHRTHPNTKDPVVVTGIAPNAVSLKATYLARVPAYGLYSLWEETTTSFTVIWNGKTFRYSGEGDQSEAPETENGEVWQEIENEAVEENLIFYHLSTDQILYRKDLRGNEVDGAEESTIGKSIELFPWGNPKVHHNKIKGDSLADLLNFRGRFEHNSLEAQSTFWNHTTTVNTLIQHSIFKATTFQDHVLEDTQLMHCHLQNIRIVAQDFSGQTWNRKQVKPGTSNPESTVDFTGLTELTVEDFIGIVYLTSTNAGETLETLQTTPNHPLRLYPQAGLQLTVQQGASLKCEGGVSVTLDGNEGEWIELEKRDDIWYQTNIGTY